MGAGTRPWRPRGTVLAPSLAFVADRFKLQHRDCLSQFYIFT
jgi:hypothetical protein